MDCPKFKGYIMRERSERLLQKEESQANQNV